MTADDLPPFPEIPLSPESRLRWLAWGRECMAIERERCAKICDGMMNQGGQRGWNQASEFFAAAIRSELPRIDSPTKLPSDGNSGEPEYSWMSRERGCNLHPDAPHGFDRNASHNAGRYVCECESWEPPV